ncbi:hypothetical protein COT51_02810 [candidate division WWE3 bacterium CG08_land_8_20_14_0_20_41_15]|uniref:Uncharacterized protein n=2 Tax=Bacteria candidate phyla TaxID=1783234 RepID=A0A2M7QJ55_9BACT|nr:MAG: hypothetical protein COT51_02810 [candidate division WWE3 bacterium CG08_land_8_20_14_0_20_41_15]PIY71981.1 MAG: hypothetical protein COY87_03325 [Candidatus Roizmanbacteria bacterium CG_4_10_14_0_8_um_filter_33_9]
MKITTSETILLYLAEISDLLNESTGNYLHKRHNILKLFEEKRKGSAVTTIQRLLLTSNIEKIVENGEVFYKITNQGKLKINKKFRLNDINRKWDKKWRILIFDIPEKSRTARNILRHKLSSLGFGLLQKSVWISPYDVVREVSDFLKLHKLDKGVIFFEANTIGEETNQQIANTTWKLNELNEKYDEILSDYTLNEDKNQASTTFQNHYLSFLHEDPCLPQELYPKPWHGNKVQKLYFKLVKLNITK